jgi:hypothetical protein
LEVIRVEVKLAVIVRPAITIWDAKKNTRLAGLSMKMLGSFTSILGVLTSTLSD